MEMGQAEHIVILDARDFDGLLVDLDGVVTRTASLHASAWKKLFDETLEQQEIANTSALKPFDADRDYRLYVDGKPRMEGLKSFLKARGIEVPLGTPSDAPECETLYGLSARKNIYFHELLDQEAVPVYDSSIALLQGARKMGWKIALVSSSRNCDAIVAAAGIAELFDARVDGNDIELLGLRGKPAPDVYQVAADRLCTEPGRAVVIEDAQSGVEAGRAGAFGCVVGVNRDDNRTALRQAGADFVIDDLSMLTLSDHRVNSEQQNPPNALVHFDDIGQMLGARPLAVFLDYDGTLTPIVARPELAVMSEDMRHALRGLSRFCTVSIISGRERHEVENLVGLDNLFYAGSHGFDVSGPEGQRLQHKVGSRFIPSLSRAEHELRTELSDIDGALIEGKTYAVAAHYRLVASTDRANFHSRFNRISSRHPDLRVTRGKKVMELRPGVDWDKGKVVLWLLDSLNLNEGHVLPFYLGDDETDEDAFDVLRSIGIGIFVGTPHHHTAARYLLRDPAEVLLFIERLTDQIEEASA